MRDRQLSSEVDYLCSNRCGPQDDAQRSGSRTGPVAARQSVRKHKKQDTECSLQFREPWWGDQAPSSRSTMSRPPLAFACYLVIAMMSVASAQDTWQATSDGFVALRPGTESPSGAPKVLTGKERLGEKWTDEQRIDNCKVPLDRRGLRPRPDDCPEGSTESSSISAESSESPNK